MVGPSAARHMRWARTSTLRNPDSTKGIPSVMPRDKGSTCAPGAERTSVLWRMSSCTIGSSAAWQERDGRGSAQTLGHVNPLVAVVSANRCDEMCRHAATRCWLAVCVHNTRATPPRLRARATITRTCPRSSARRARSCSDIRLATQTMKPEVPASRDIHEHQRRPVVAQKGRSGVQHSGGGHGTALWSSQPRCGPPDELRNCRSSPNASMFPSFCLCVELAQRDIILCV